MLASRRQPLHPFHPSSSDYDATISRSSSRPFFDDISNTASSPSSSDYNTHSQQNYFAPSPDYSAPALSLATDAIADGYMSSAFDFSGPAIRIQQSTPTPQYSYAGYPQQSVLVDGAQNTNNWVFGDNNSQMLTGSSLQTPALNRRNRAHQRVPSSSSAGSNSPASPFSQGHAPQLMYGNATQSPSMSKLESSYHADEASRSYSNHLPTPTQTPTQDSFIASTSPSSFNPPFQHIDSTVAAHMAMKHAFTDANSVTEEDAPGFSHSTRQSVSSFGRNSPATPRTLNGEDFDEGLRVPSNDTAMRTNNQVPKLERTITDIYSDELFNPTPPPTSQPPSQKSMKNTSLLSPYHNAMMNERLLQANQARSQSPTSASTRAVSPFRQASPYAQPINSFQSPQSRFSAAQQAREQQKAQAEANALSRQNMISQQDAEPKTISPKDALLEYHESEEDSKMPLFPDGDNSDFSAYTGGNFHSNAGANSADTFHSNLAVGGAWPNAVGQSSASYSATTTAAQQSQFSFAPASVPGTFHGLSSNTFSSAGNMPANSEVTPEFPAHLTSMESSASEAPPQSSSNSNHADIASKPPSTLADTGTYTCTYHGCTQRFETPQKLQRHKREAHRQNVQQQQQQQQQQQTPHQPITPGVGSGMTSAALLARNSQAGPHKCERINPTTGKPCNTIFSRPYDLTRHEDTIHNVRKQKVRCALCQEEKTFSRNDALTRHMRVVHPDVDFPGKHRRRGGRGDD